MSLELGRNQPNKPEIVNPGLEREGSQGKRMEFQASPLENLTIPEFELNEKKSSRILRHTPDKKSLEELKTINQNEKLLHENIGGNEVIARESVIKGLKRAQEFAKAEGYEIRVVSSYRDPAHQKRLYDNSPNKDLGVAKPGKSWHQGGAALDLVLYKNGRQLTQIREVDEKLTPEEAILERFMNLAGFVRLAHEAWHYEIGSKGWLKIIGEKINAIAMYSRDGNDHEHQLVEVELTEEEKKAILADSPHLHSKYEEKAGNLSIAEIQSDKQTIDTASISEIRTNISLLTKTPKDAPPKEKIIGVQNETARRIEQYSEKNGDWRRLKYGKHEMQIGLGEILADPAVDAIYVKRRGEKPFKAIRGIAPPNSRYAGRVCFLDPRITNGDPYVATHDGDEFRIASEGFDVEKANEKQIQEFYAKHLDPGSPTSEVAQRIVFNQAEEKREKAKAFTNNGSIYTPELAEIINNSEYKPISESEIIDKINQSRTAENKEQDGEAVIKYAKDACKKFNIPWEIYKELIQVESNWNVWVKNRKSTATGLGQFLTSTWETFADHCENKGVHEEIWGIPKRRLTSEDRKNPYIMAYATAWLMNRTQQKFPEIKDMPIHLQAVYYYLAHHDGAGGAASFLRGERGTKILDLAKKVGFRALNSTSPEEIASAIDFEKLKENEVKIAQLEQIKNGQEYLVNGKKAELHYSNQETLLLGSSSVKGKPQTDKYGTLGITGGQPEEILEECKKLNLKYKKVIWVGTGLNAIRHDGSNVRSVIAQYKEAESYFKAQNIDFYVSTVQPSDNKVVGANILNEEIRKNFPTDKVLDIAKEITGDNGKMKPEYKRDAIHMNAQGQRILDNLISGIT